MPNNGEEKIVCPNCSFEQEHSPECVKCGLVLEKYGQRKKRGDERPSPGEKGPPGGKKRGMAGKLLKEGVIVGTLAALFYFFYFYPAYQSKKYRYTRRLDREARSVAGSARSVGIAYYAEWNFYPEDVSLTGYSPPEGFAVELWTTDGTNPEVVAYHEDTERAYYLSGNGDGIRPMSKEEARSLVVGKKKEREARRELHVENLKSALAADREEAVRGLRRFGDPGLSRLISPLVEDESVKVRCAAWEVLASLDPGAAVRPLIEALLDEEEAGTGGSGRTREKYDEQKCLVQAARTLVWKQDDSVNKVLAGALRDKDPRRRDTVARILAHAPKGTFVEPLIRALGDDEPRVRSSAVLALKTEKDPRVAEALIAALGDTHSDVRRSAAEALYYRRDGRIVEPLIAALGDEDGRVRASAARAFVNTKDPRAVEPLIAALEDEDREVRSAAARALGHQGDARAVETLHEALGERDTWVCSVARALGRINDPRSVGILVAALGDRSQVCRDTVAWALGFMKDPRAIEPLLEAMGDRNAHLRRFVAEALSHYSKDERAGRRSRRRRRIRAQW